jgi:putative Ca2+/H+ antiporter (TMEM165/GDT1 family)
VTDLFVALGLVFVAELGDKTQLVALGMGARHRLAPVLAGVAAAYAVTNLLSVVIGGLLGAALPTRAIGVVGGLLFLGFAAWTLFDRDDDPQVDPQVDPVDGDGPDAAEQDQGAAGSGFRVAASVAGAMVVAELGDKTMLTTATLAAKGNPILVWIGATIGITLSGAVGVLAGRAIGTRLSPSRIRVGAAVLFAVFGVVLLVGSIR